MSENEENLQEDQLINSSKLVCKYSSIEFLGVVSFVVFLTYPVVLLLLVRVMNYFEGINPDSNDMSVVIIIAFIIGILGWLFYFKYLIVLLYHKKAPDNFF